MTAPAEVDLIEYAGKKVSFDLTDDEGVTTRIDATIEATSDQFTFFKPKGKANGRMVDTSKIANVALAIETIPELKPRRLSHIALANIKRHLVDRHGYPIKDINAMTAEDAFEFHKGLDHTPLGHYHADPPPPSDDDDEDSEQLTVED